MATKKKMLQAAAGQAGGAGGGGLDITDVFSTYLYEGNGSTQTITNGIDLAGEGGIVWTKSRSDTGDHNLFFENGSNIDLVKPNNTDSASLNMGQYGVSFNSNGFSMAGLFAPDTVDIASWTFRKAPKFFDVVTWTGDSVAGREIAHNLGTTVGMIVVKRTDAAGADWIVYHRSQAGKWGKLNETGAFTTSYAANYFGDNSTVISPTSTEFTIGTAGGPINASGGTYVAYLFAHNDGDGEFGPAGDQDIIKCGSYTGNGSDDGPEIDLGFEPQWLLVKSADQANKHWQLADVMREWRASGQFARLRPHRSDAEDTANNFRPTATGFKLTATGSDANTSGGTYIYMAIRRGPLAPPESATEVFAIDTYGGAGGGVAPAWRSGFPVDMAYYKDAATTSNNWNMSRLTGTDYLFFDSTNAASQFPFVKFDYNNGYWGNGGTAATTYSWMWKRAPGFFDVVAYSGNSTAGRTVSHNLGVAPEMMWVKKRTDTADWAVYTAPTGSGKYLELNATAIADTVNAAAYWNNTTPTSDVFTLGDTNRVNNSNGDYIAYLFASLPGISKVGSYTGNGNAFQNIDCGFTTGARFVLLKRTDSAENWHLFDTVRGIVSGNDPYLRLNTTDAEFTGEDLIDPFSSGFATNLNDSGASYIFYAIA